MISGALQQWFPKYIGYCWSWQHATEWTYIRTWTRHHLHHQSGSIDYKWQITRGWWNSNHNWNRLVQRCLNYRLITAYLLLRVNLDKIMHARWDFDASSARTRRVSALVKHQNWSPSALFCLNSRAQINMQVSTKMP